MTWKASLTLSLAVSFAVFLVVIIGLADTASLGVLHRAYDLPYGDKAGHFVLNGTLTFLVGLAVLQAQPGNKRLVLRSSLVIMLAVAIEEASQVLIPVRSPDWFDLSASYLGIIFGTLGALALHGRMFGGRNGRSRARTGTEAEGLDAARS